MANSVVNWNLVLGSEQVNPLTLKISLVILLTICHINLAMLVRAFGIRSTNNPLINIFLCSHHLSAWYCIGFVRKNSVLVTHGSLRVEFNLAHMNRRCSGLQYPSSKSDSLNFHTEIFCTDIQGNLTDMQHKTEKSHISVLIKVPLHQTTKIAYFTCNATVNMNLQMRKGQ